MDPPQPILSAAKAEYLLVQPMERAELVIGPPIWTFNQWTYIPSQILRIARRTLIIGLF